MFHSQNGCVDFNAKYVTADLYESNWLFLTSVMRVYEQTIAHELCPEISILTLNLLI